MNSVLLYSSSYCQDRDQMFIEPFSVGFGHRFLQNFIDDKPIVFSKRQKLIFKLFILKLLERQNQLTLV